MSFWGPWISGSILVCIFLNLSLAHSLAPACLAHLLPYMGLTYAFPSTMGHWGVYKLVNIPFGPCIWAQKLTRMWIYLIYFKSACHKWTRVWSLLIHAYNFPLFTCNVNFFMNYLWSENELIHFKVRVEGKLGQEKSHS